MIEVTLQKYKIFIAPSVVSILAGYKQIHRKDCEAGGILLGQINEDGIYILKASIPNSRDKRSRMSFIRDRDRAQLIINHEFANSGGKTIYLGEWHSHPEKFPSPSSVDKAMIKDQFKKNKINEPFLIFIIQGISGIYIGLIADGEISGVNIHE